MEERIIYNPSLKEGEIWVNTAFMKQVSMFDKVIVNIRGSVQEGYVALISRKGVNINLGYGDRFFKWCHVIAIKKQRKVRKGEPLEPDLEEVLETSFDED